MLMLMRVLTNLIIKLMGDEIMMAILFATRVILEKTAFEDVPKTLKPQVYAILLENGVEFLAGDYVPPTEG